MIKVVTFSLAVALVFYIFFYLPKQLKPGPGPRFRYLVIAVLSFLFAAFLLKFFLK